jgi:DNA repair protein RadC
MKDKSTSFSIKNWSLDDRPREKLIHKGKGSLTDAELLAILISSGNKKESAVGLSKRILASANHRLHELGKLSLSQLQQFNGIGVAKAVTIAAALELGRRRREEGVKDTVKVNASTVVYELMKSILAELEHEEFWILYLNNANKVVYKLQLSKGGIQSTVVDIRLVLKKALEVGATGLILAHNHPSGTLKPSKADIATTDKLQTAAASLDIKVLDHLIISEMGYFSFADENLLKA